MSLTTVVADAPQHYITFDQAGATLTDTGSLAGTVTPAGSPVKAASFSGTGMIFDGVDDTVAIGNPLDFSAGTEWTFECWFKSTSSQADGHFIRRDGSGRAYLLRLNAGKVEWYCNSASILSPNTYNDGQWHHAVGTYNNGTTNLYVDGALVGTGSGNAGSQGTTVSIYVGSAGGDGEWYNGQLDEVAVYNTALSTARITAHYDDYTQGDTYQDVVNADNPTVYFPFDGQVFDNVGSRSGVSVNSSSVTWGPGVKGTSASAYFGGVTTDSRINYNLNPHDVFNGAGMAWSVEAWFKVDVQTWYSEIINTEDGNNQLAILLWEPNAAAGTARRLTVFHKGSGGARQQVDGPVINDSNWHHVVLTRSGTTLTLFVDGAQYATGTAQDSNFDSTTPFRIGAYGDDASNENFSGWIDEVAVYKGTALSATRVAAHYDAPSDSPDTVNVAPAVTLNLSAPAPVVSAVSTQTVVANADRGVGVYAGGPDEPGIYFGSPVSTTKSALILFKFDGFTLVPGTFVQSALLRLRNDGTDPAQFAVYRITSDWDENATGSVGLVSTPVSGYIEPNETGAVDVGYVASSWVTAGEPNYGICIVYSGANNGTGALIRTSEHSVVEDRPTLTVELADLPQTPVTVQVPPVTVSLTTPQHSFGTGTKQNVTGAASIAVGAVAPVIKSTKNVSVPVPASTLTVESPGGQSRNPDQLVKVDPIEMWVSSPDVNGYGGSSAIVSVPVVDGFGIESLAGEINLDTDKTIYVTNPATMDIRMVGIYSRAHDRYLNYVPGTVDADDVWFQMEELDGTVALDALTSQSDPDAYRTNGYYWGEPEFQVEGPELRRAVRFDGVSDFLEVGLYKPDTSVFVEMDTTIEFSIKTTQLNGTLISGGGGDASSATGPTSNQYNLRMVNGEMTLVNELEGLSWRVRKNIADGKWHHVVISNPSLTYNIGQGGPANRGKPFFVSVDGKVEFQRAEMIPFSAKRALPHAVMARHNAANPSAPATDFLAGEMRDFIVRLNYAVSSDTASKIYYEWSNATVVSVMPATVSITAPQGVTGRGNVKKMLAVYGLPLHRDQQYNFPYFNYHSIFAGYSIQTKFGNEFHPGQSQLGGGALYHPVKPFWLDGYLVYPVSITGFKPGALNSGPQSAEGVINNEYTDPLTGFYVDDKTGLRRFVDVRNDLIGDVTDYDALTVMNYPAPLPNKGGSLTLSDDYDHPELGLTDPEWTKIRDDFRDAILEAAYKGVNLWVNEAVMAEHLGVIQAYDIHENGNWGPGELVVSAGLSHQIGVNQAAYDTDQAHLTGSDNLALGQNGDYSTTWQANVYRRISATEPGLTDIPSNEMVDMVHQYRYDRFDGYADVVAYDVEYKDNLVVGDKIRMSAWDNSDSPSAMPIGDPWSISEPRLRVVSAKPEGVVGKILSREMEWYYGPRGVVVQNPYKDNALTIVAERGTVVRGRPIAGRIFVEFMDTDVKATSMAVDRFPDMWKGATNENVSTWSFDTRRNGPSTIGGGTGSYSVVDYIPHVSMNARGLRWLSAAETIPAGDARSYVPVVEAKIDGGQTVQHSAGRSLTLPVEPAEMFIEIMEPSNIERPDAVIGVRPAKMDISMMGLGKHIRVEPATLTIETPDTTVDVGGDRIYVYLDGTRNVTLYLKEE